MFSYTKDGSVGLYDDKVNDIYHSSLGAYKEAAEKFVVPSQIERFNNKPCNVLDICYGIGYNTKALINYSLENKLNISFNIDALEINDELVQLSPFIKNNRNLFCFQTDKFILNSYLSQNKIDFIKIKSIIKKNNRYLSLYKPDFDKILKKWGYCYGVADKLNAFLHNIYYHNGSIRYKIPQKSSNFDNMSLKWHLGDARKVVFLLNKKYDIIFLDAFTASKQPILWTYEFLEKLTSMLNKETGVLVSYSSSSPFRKTLLDLGLSVGKYYNNMATTVATYNEFLIKCKLDEFEKDLLYTKAGIPYRDKSLTLSSDEILKIREKEVLISGLESTNKYYKRHGRKYGKR